MAHELAGALQYTCRIRQRCAVKEPHVYVRSEYIDVAEGCISQTCNRTAVMQKLLDFVPASSHHLKPVMCDGSQSTCMLFHPRIDGGIARDSAIESQQFRFHRRSAFCFRDLWLCALYLPSKIARLGQSLAGQSVEGRSLRLPPYFFYNPYRPHRLVGAITKVERTHELLLQTKTKCEQL